MQQSSERFPTLGRVAGFTNVFGALMMLSFYSIVAGWMLAHATGPVLQSIGLSQAAEFVTTQSVARKLLFTLIIVLLSASIIVIGVKQGIEKWSKRLMPLLFILLILLIVYYYSIRSFPDYFPRFIKKNHNFQ
jgi:NSS family neurotransmitter:Na+ symporter